MQMLLENKKTIIMMLVFLSTTVVAQNNAELHFNDPGVFQIHGAQLINVTEGYVKHELFSDVIYASLENDAKSQLGLSVYQKIDIYWNEKLIETVSAINGSEEIILFNGFCFQGVNMQMHKIDHGQRVFFPDPACAEDGDCKNDDDVGLSLITLSIIPEKAPLPFHNIDSAIDGTGVDCVSRDSFGNEYFMEQLFKVRPFMMNVPGEVLGSISGFFEGVSLFGGLVPDKRDCLGLVAEHAHHNVQVYVEYNRMIGVGAQKVLVDLLNNAAEAAQTIREICELLNTITGSLPSTADITDVNGKVIVHDVYNKVKGSPDAEGMVKNFIENHGSRYKNKKSYKNKSKKKPRFVERKRTEETSQSDEASTEESSDLINIELMEHLVNEVIRMTDDVGAEGDNRVNLIHIPALFVVFREFAGVAYLRQVNISEMAVFRTAVVDTLSGGIDFEKLLVLMKSIPGLIEKIKVKFLNEMTPQSTLFEYLKKSNKFNKKELDFVYGKSKLSQE